MTDSTNIQIAKLLGWTVEQRRVRARPKSPTELAFTVQRWFLVRPDDTDYPTIFGYDDEVSAWTAFPHDFEHSLDTSLSVIALERDKVQVVLRYNFYEFKPECEFVIQGVGLPVDIRVPAFAYGETIAEAVANCLLKYLQWKTLQEDQ